MLGLPVDVRGSLASRPGMALLGARPPLARFRWRFLVGLVDCQLADVVGIAVEIVLDDDRIEGFKTVSHNVFSPRDRSVSGWLFRQLVLSYAHRW